MPKNTGSENDFTIYSVAHYSFFQIHFYLVFMILAFFIKIYIIYSKQKGGLLNEKIYE